MNAPKLRDPFDLADELVRTYYEMQREAGPLDDGQETDPPEDDHE